MLCAQWNHDRKYKIIVKNKPTRCNKLLLSLPQKTTVHPTHLAVLYNNNLDLYSTFHETRGHFTTGRGARGREERENSHTTGTRRQEDNKHNLKGWAQTCWKWNVLKSGLEILKEGLFCFLGFSLSCCVLYRFECMYMVCKGNGWIHGSCSNQ